MRLTRESEVSSCVENTEAEVATIVKELGSLSNGNEHHSTKYLLYHRIHQLMGTDLSEPVRDALKPYIPAALETDDKGIDQQRRLAQLERTPEQVKEEKQQLPKLYWEVTKRALLGKIKLDWPTLLQIWSLPNPDAGMQSQFSDKTRMFLDVLKPFATACFGVEESEVSQPKRLTTAEKAPEQVNGESEQLPKHYCEEIKQAIRSKIKHHCPTLFQTWFIPNSEIVKQPLIIKQVSDNTRRFLYELFSNFVINQHETQISGVNYLNEAYHLAQDSNNSVVMTGDHLSKAAPLVLPYALYIQDLIDLESLKVKEILESPANDDAEVEPYLGHRCEKTAILPRTSLFYHDNYLKLIQLATLLIPVLSPYQDIPLLGNRETGTGLKNSREGQKEASEIGAPIFLFPEGGTPRITEEYQDETHSVLLPFWGGIGKSMFSDLECEERRDGKKVTTIKKRYVCPQALDNCEMWGYAERRPKMYFKGEPPKGVKLRSAKPISAEELEKEAKSPKFNEAFKIYELYYKGYIFRQVYEQIRSFLTNDLSVKDMAFRKSDAVKNLLNLLGEMQSCTEDPDFYHNTQSYIDRMMTFFETEYRRIEEESEKALEKTENDQPANETETALAKHKKAKIEEVKWAKKSDLNVFDQAFRVFYSVFKSRQQVRPPTKQEFSIWIRTAAMMSPETRGQLGRDCLNTLSDDELTYLKEQLPEDCQDESWLKAA